MASASNRPTRKRTYRTAEVITKLDESDSELYDDSDSDRDSNYMLSDVEPVSDADSSATEVNAQPPVDSQVAMSVDDTVDTDPPSDSDDYPRKRAFHRRVYGLVAWQTNVSPIHPRKTSQIRRKAVYAMRTKWLCVECSCVFWKE